MIQEKPNWNGPCQVLALDGGGIKGLFSAAVLAKLEDDAQTDIASHFDLIVGTSTGGILALGLGLGLRPRELVDFYVMHGPRIFRDRIWRRTVQQWVMRKFSTTPLEKALRECFGERRLAESKKRLVIPSFNLGEEDVYLFKTPHHPRLKRDFKVEAWKVALATSAAPTYFSAFRGVDGLRLIDGGVWANNPTLIGVAEACSMLGAKLDQVSVLSIGTSSPVVRRRSWLDWAGRLAWAPNAAGVIMKGQSIGANTGAIHLLGKDRVTRIDPKVADGELTLDKVDAQALIGKAAHMSRHFCPTFETRFMSHVATPYTPHYQ